MPACAALSICSFWLSPMSTLVSGCRELVWGNIYATASLRALGTPAGCFLTCSAVNAGGVVRVGRTCLQVMQGVCRHCPQKCSEHLLEVWLDELQLPVMQRMWLIV